MRSYSWTDGKTCTLGEKAIIMGVLNVTPDSFSDGGKWNTLEKALAHGKEMIAQGAGIIDIGAESTRPGHEALSVEEEKERLLHFLSPLLEQSSVPISVDTYHAATADAALAAGAHFLNDVWGLQYDDGSMARVAGEHGVPAILMHNHDGEVYEGDIIDSMKLFFGKTVELALSHGVKEKNIILDPGIGFGKNPLQNLEILRRLQELIEVFPYPWLLGVSRKRFIGAVLDTDVDERDEGTGAVNLWGLMKGCHIFRVHNVEMSARMIRMWEAIEGV